MGRVPLFSKKSLIDFIKCEFWWFRKRLDFMVDIWYLFENQKSTKLEDMYDHLTSTKNLLFDNE